MSEKKKIVWLTGASSGIGRSLTKVFLEKGANVAASSRNIELLNRLADGYKNLEGEFLPFQLDVRNSKDVLKLAARLNKDFEIDCLINNAGITKFASADETTIDEVDDIISTNLLGSIYAAKASLPFMKEAGGGTIINIASVAAEKVFKASSVYAASKSGMATFAKVLREEAREDNIRVINIYPGAARTPIWDNEVLEKKSELMMSPDDVAEFIFQIYANKANMIAEEVTLRPITGDL
ncbi:MAG: SDR family oxidoreductase [Chlorobi bacterium]|nr:SDR family oxidoreductase [Chlorobiota bacterium]